VEANEVDIVAFAVFCGFEQVEDAEEAGGLGELGRDVGQADGFDGVDLDLAFVHAVAASDFDARGDPDADRAGDLSGADAVAEAFGEDHVENVLRRMLGDAADSLRE
jgi:hypothetical protein